MKSGDHLIGEHGTSCVVACASISLPEPIDVYNLQIDGSHTYFVLPDGSSAAIWTHNYCRNLKEFLLSARALMRKGALPSTLRRVDLEAMWHEYRTSKRLGFPGVVEGAENRHLIRDRYFANNPHVAAYAKEIDLHHCIPVEVAIRHQAFFKRIGGFNTHAPFNAMPLPHENSKLLGRTTRSTHNGGHANYRDVINGKVLAIKDAFDPSAIGKSVKSVQDLMDRIRLGLRKGIPIDPDPVRGITIEDVEREWIEWLK